MLIDAIDTLAAQRAALEAPAEQRATIYRERVMEPLRPFWEPMLAYAPPGAAPQTDDPALGFAKMFGFFGPDDDPAEGLHALDALDQGGAWPACIAALEDARVALRPQEHGIELERVFLSVVLASPTQRDVVERNHGYTGFGGQPGQVLLLVWPTDYNVPRLPAAAAHEFHHNVRLTFEPWTRETTVGQYIVLEGLAEAFAVEQYGEEMLGPWANSLSEAELATARVRIGEAVDATGDIRGYMFGDWAAAQFHYEPRGLPDFAGYTVGYQLVRAYLHRTGSSAAEATYVPWREIVAEAGYF